MDAWARGQRGSVSLARSLENLLDILKTPPMGWHGVLQWAGDDNAASAPRTGNVVNNRVRLVLVGDLGMGSNAGNGFAAPVAGRPAFLAVLSAVRARMLAYRFGSLSAPNNRFFYEGCEDSVTVSAQMSAVAYALNFTLYTTFERPNETEYIPIDNGDQ